MSEERTGPISPAEARELRAFIATQKRIEELEAKLDRAHGKMDMYFKMYEEAVETADELRKAMSCCRNGGVGNVSESGRHRPGF